MGSMAKDLGSCTSTSTMGSKARKNKLSKKRRDTNKKRQEKLSSQVVQDRTIQTNQIHTSTKCTLNLILNMVPKFDEYGVLNSEDKVGKDNQTVGDKKEDDDEVSEQLISVFSPSNNDLDEKVQHVSYERGLSPRGFKKNQVKNQTNKPYQIGSY